MYMFTHNNEQIPKICNLNLHVHVQQFCDLNNCLNNAFVFLDNCGLIHVTTIKIIEKHHKMTQVGTPWKISGSGQTVMII